MRNILTAVVQKYWGDVDQVSTLIDRKPFILVAISDYVKYILSGNSLFFVLFWFFVFSISTILNFTCRDLSLQCLTTEHTVRWWVEINSEYCLGKQDKSTRLSEMRYKITLFIKYACYKILFLFYTAASIMISLSHQCSFHALFHTDGVLRSLCSLCFLSCDVFV